MPFTFTNTHAALAEWHRTEQARFAKHGHSLEALRLAADTARRTVQDAFYEDTKAFNRLDVCRTVPLRYISEMSRFDAEQVAA